jgi:hypothetical protein
MRNYILALVIALWASQAFAVSTCDTLPTKQQKDNCWSNVIVSEYDQADEYAQAVYNSRQVPMVVKSQVEAKRQAIASSANHDCPKGELGYPVNQCLLSHIQRFKDYTYYATKRYGVPDMRLN